MPIEMLYIIPVVAMSLLVLINIIIRQRARMGPAERQPNLYKEIDDFNVGGNVENHPSDRSVPASRLNEIERTITLVSQALSNQQQLIDEFRGGNAARTAEIETLKSRLRELQREYDILLSENYSLRAKIRKLEQQSKEAVDEFQTVLPSAVIAAQESNPLPGIAREVREKLQYADTKLLSDMSLDDTTELDILLNREAE